MFAMLLFRPHRSLSDLLDMSFGSGPLLASLDGAWERLYDEFCRWRAFVDRTAAPYFERRAAERLPRPAFDTTEWWACMISEKLQNLELATRRHRADSMAPPEDLSGMPEYEAAPDMKQSEQLGEAVGDGGASEQSDASSRIGRFDGCDADALLGEDAPPASVRRSRASREERGARGDHLRQSTSRDATRNFPRSFYDGASSQRRGPVLPEFRRGFAPRRA